MFVGVRAVNFLVRSHWLAWRICLSRNDWWRFCYLQSRTGRLRRQSQETAQDKQIQFGMSNTTPVLVFTRISRSPKFTPLFHNRYAIYQLRSGCLHFGDRSLDIAQMQIDSATTIGN